MCNINFWRDINYSNIKEIENKALQGDVELQCALGKYYSRSRLKCYSIAKKWFVLAAEQGDVFAQRTLGNWYLRGERITKNEQEGIRLYRLAIEQGDTSAMIELGSCYLHGEYTEKNVPEGLRLYNLAIDKGDVFAMIRLGNYYSYGRGVEQDKKEAFRLYKLAADKGYGQSYLGMCYYNGSGVEQNYEEAVKLFEEDDNKEMLGECYIYGRGVERNVQKAIELWESLSGRYYIYEKLADLYSDGVHIAPDYKKAACWLWELITDDEGMLIGVSPEHTHRLATYYYEGKGVRKNRNQALKLFKLTVDGFHEHDKRKGCSISEEPEYVIHSRRMLVKHGKKSVINTLQTEAANGDNKAKEILVEFGIELVKPKSTKKVVRNVEQPVREIYEEPMPKPPIKISVGEKVFHKSFGEGSVYQTENKRIVVHFKSGDEKIFSNPEAFEDGFLHILNK